ncbi:MAG TPA: hypothetical protein VG328_03025 [Stellaceae bacterium]|jgi:hypothetical protein|nr:hypothetical protein [Stellaceae bacterium]
MPMARRRGDRAAMREDLIVFRDGNSKPGLLEERSALQRALNYKKLRAEEVLVPLDTPWQKLCRLGKVEPA